MGQRLDPTPLQKGMKSPGRPPPAAAQRWTEMTGEARGKGVATAPPSELVSMTAWANTYGYYVGFVEDVLQSNPNRNFKDIDDARMLKRLVFFS